MPRRSLRVKPAAAYTKDVSRTKRHLRGGTVSMKLRVLHALLERLGSSRLESSAESEHVSWTYERQQPKCLGTTAEASDRLSSWCWYVRPAWHARSSGPVKAASVSHVAWQSCSDACTNRGSEGRDFAQERISQGMQDQETPQFSGFHLEEYKSLRQEIADDDKEIARVIAFCSTASAGIWIWLFKGEVTGFEIIAILPAVIVAFGYIRTKAIFNGIYRIAAYLRTLETKYAEPDLHGWETCLAKEREKDNKKKSPSASLHHATNYFLWSLLVVNIAFGLLYVWRTVGRTLVARLAGTN